VWGVARGTPLLLHPPLMLLLLLLLPKSLHLLLYLLLLLQLTLLLLLLLLMQLPLVVFLLLLFVIDDCIFNVATQTSSTTFTGVKVVSVPILFWGSTGGSERFAIEDKHCSSSKTHLP
jgi:hypothetical protein